MGSTFSTAERSFFTSESVTEGHPGQVVRSDLGRRARRDPDRRSEWQVACEIGRDHRHDLRLRRNHDQHLRRYPGDGARVSRHRLHPFSHGFDCDTCGVMVGIKGQSPGNSRRGRARTGDARRQERRSLRLYRRRRPGHDDRVCLPGNRGIDAAADLPCAQAHAALATARKSGELAWLLPDGKSQVTIEYRNGKPLKVATPS